MAEEFNESDIVFTFNNVEGDKKFFKCFSDSNSDESRRAKRKKIEKTTKPKAVNIPIPMNLSWCGYIDPGLYEYEEDEEEMVPPHVMLRRRLAEKMEFSMCFGMGRTLKGRDLSEMRNCVLRMTGFLES